jgi:hypothetical protein
MQSYRRLRNLQRVLEGFTFDPHFVGKLRRITAIEVVRMTREYNVSLADAMQGADYVLVDGVMFETEYLRVPDEYTVADDVIIEAKHGDDEILFTRSDVEDAEALGDGVYRLHSGELVRFLTSATLH